MEWRTSVQFVILITLLIPVGQTQEDDSDLMIVQPFSSEYDKKDKEMAGHKVNQNFFDEIETGRKRSEESRKSLYYLTYIPYKKWIPEKPGQFRLKELMKYTQVSNERKSMQAWNMESPEYIELRTLGSEEMTMHSHTTNAPKKTINIIDVTGTTKEKSLTQILPFNNISEHTTLNKKWKIMNDWWTTQNLQRVESRKISNTSSETAMMTFTEKEGTTTKEWLAIEDNENVIEQNLPNMNTNENTIATNKLEINKNWQTLQLQYFGNETPKKKHMIFFWQTHSKANEWPKTSYSHIKSQKSSNRVKNEHTLTLDIKGNKKESHRLTKNQEDIGSRKSRNMYKSKESYTSDKELETVKAFWKTTEQVDTLDNTKKTVKRMRAKQNKEAIISQKSLNTNKKFKKHLTLMKRKEKKAWWSTENYDYIDPQQLPNSDEDMYAFNSKSNNAWWRSDENDIYIEPVTKPIVDLVKFTFSPNMWWKTMKNNKHMKSNTLQFINLKNYTFHNRHDKNLKMINTHFTTQRNYKFLQPKTLSITNWNEHSFPHDTKPNTMGPWLSTTENYKYMMIKSLKTRNLPTKNTYAIKRKWKTKHPENGAKNRLHFTYKYNYAEKRKWRTERSNMLYNDLPDPDNSIAASPDYYIESNNEERNFETHSRKNDKKQQHKHVRRVSIGHDTTSTSKSTYLFEHLRNGAQHLLDIYYELLDENKIPPARRTEVKNKTVSFLADYVENNLMV